MGQKVAGDDRNQLLRKREVLQIVHFSESTLWRLVRQGRFPRPLKLSANITAWRADEVAQWIETRRRVGT